MFWRVVIVTVVCVVFSDVTYNNATAIGRLSVIVRGMKFVARVGDWLALEAVPTPGAALKLTFEP